MSDAMFCHAVDLQDAGDVEAAMTIYEELSAKDERAAVNLGTIHYNRKQFSRAVELYRLATQIAPHYALAFSNLGNALDEIKSYASAITAYETALKLSPRFADAHYNLAVALEQKGEPRRAIKHWRAYMKIDVTGAHADHARKQIRKTISIDPLAIVWRSLRCAHAPRILPCPADPRTAGQ